MIDLHVFMTVWPAAVAYSLSLDATEYSIEFVIVDLKRIVMAVEVNGVHEIQCQPVVDWHDRKRRQVAAEGQAKDAGKEPCQLLLVAGRDDGMVKLDRHVVILRQMARRVRTFRGADVITLNNRRSAFGTARFKVSGDGLT